MLLGQGLSQTVLDSQLTIIQGDIADVAKIQATLTRNTAGTSHVELATQIISGTGGAPVFFKSITKPMTIDNPRICEQTSQNIVQALTELHHDYKPSITVVSTTGISDIKEDVPFWFRFLYHVLLKVPHKDKKQMDKILTENVATSSSKDGQGVFKGVIVIRASLLIGDQDIKGGNGWKKLKVGTEEKPAIGYTVRRQDVGEWIFEEIVKTGGETRLGQRITLTN